MSRDKLDRYRRKRDLARSPEPEAGSGDRGGRLFVVQQHAASTMHWDLRLEADGVLESWAVPKGPSTDPRDKRLALPTEAHPLAYADFEGVIPEGQYGAGAVIVWDRGSYRNLTEDEDGESVPVPMALSNGHLVVWLEGEKLLGGWALTRIEEGEEPKWLLVKVDDEKADARRNPVSTQRRSVLSGRTVEEVAEEESPGDGG